MTGACIFCEIVAERAPAKIRSSGIHVIIIEPLNPVTPGHLLAIPRVHVANAPTDPNVAGRVMSAAAEYVERAKYYPEYRDLYRSVNFITSVGRPATQSVFHLQVHIVPHAENEG